MKNNRKIIALIVAMVMSLSLIPLTVLGTGFDGIPEHTTEHEAGFAGWVQWYVGTKNESTYFACVTDEIAHSGRYSAALRHTNSSLGDNLYVVQEGLSLPAGTYTVSFWAAGTGTKQFVNLQGQEWLNKRLESYAPAETDGIWSRYELDFTVPAGKTNNTIVFGAEAGTEGWYIDDISLVVKGTTQNILTNSGFECEETVPTPTYTAAYEDYFQGWSRWDAVTPDHNLTFSCVTDEIAHSGSKSIVLRHSDSSKKMRNICLAQSGMSLEAGTYTLSFWAAGTRSDIDMQGVTLADPWRKYSMCNRQPVETDGIWSKYEIQVTMNGTETALSFITDGDTDGWYIDDISLVKSGTANNRVTNGGFEEKVGGGDDDEEEEVVPAPVYTTELEDYFNLWSRWDAMAPDGTSRFSCVTNQIAHSGDNSIVLRHSDPANNGRGIGLAYENIALAGTYTLSFWAAGTRTDIDAQAVTLNGDA